MRPRLAFAAAGFAALLVALAAPERRAQALDVVTEANLRDEFWAGRPVVITSLGDEEGLVYDTTTNRWRNIAIQASDADLTALAAISGVQGDLIYHNGTSWTRLPKGTALQVLRTNAGATAPEWATSTGAKAYVALDAYSGAAFVGSEANSASTDNRGGFELVEYEASEAVSVDESYMWNATMPGVYAGGNLAVKIRWAAEGATSGNVIWYVGFRRYVDGTTDLDTAGTEDFAAYQTASAAACPATDGTFTTTTITVTQAQADAIAAGEEFSILVVRNSNDQGDTLAVRAQVASVTITEQ